MTDDREPTGSSVHGGRRRIDRVLRADFLQDLPNLPAADLRFRRREAMQEETDLSYTRRLLQGRLDLLTAQRVARGGAPDASPKPDGVPAGHSPRYLAAAPDRVGETKRADESLLVRTGLVDPAALSDDELAAMTDELVEAEHRVSRLRADVQRAVDELSAEMTRRLKAGEMDPLASLGE